MPSRVKTLIERARIENADSYGFHLTEEEYHKSEELINLSGFNVHKHIEMEVMGDGHPRLRYHITLSKKPYNWLTEVF